jgi:hypothetical protein
MTEELNKKNLENIETSIDNAITGIEINDYKAFWDKTDFLVIEIKK